MRYAYIKQYHSILTQYQQVSTSTPLYCCYLRTTDSCTVYPGSCSKVCYHQHITQIRPKIFTTTICSPSLGPRGPPACPPFRCKKNLGTYILAFVPYKSLEDFILNQRTPQASPFTPLDVHLDPLGPTWPHHLLQIFSPSSLIQSLAWRVGVGTGQCRWPVTKARAYVPRIFRGAAPQYCLRHCLHLNTWAQAHWGWACVQRMFSGTALPCLEVSAYLIVLPLHVFKRCAYVRDI